MITNLTRIGNSAGIIINKKILDQLGVLPNAEVDVEVKSGAIVISPVGIRRRASLNRSTWGTGIKTRIKAGYKPERSVWNDSVSRDADKSWS